MPHCGYATWALRCDANLRTQCIFSTFNKLRACGYATQKLNRETSKQTAGIRKRKYSGC